MAANTIISPAKPAGRKPREAAIERDEEGLIITDEIAMRIATARDRYVGIHVMPSNGKWAVRKTGATRAYGLYPEKRQALKVAREKRKSFAVAYVFVHDNTGRVDQIIDK